MSVCTTVGVCWQWRRWFLSAVARFQNIDSCIYSWPVFICYVCSGTLFARREAASDRRDEGRIFSLFLKVLKLQKIKTSCFHKSSVQSAVPTCVWDPSVRVGTYVGSSKFADAVLTLSTCKLYDICPGFLGRHLTILQIAISPIVVTGSHKVMTEWPNIIPTTVMSSRKVMTE